MERRVRGKTPIGESAGNVVLEASPSPLQTSGGVKLERGTPQPLCLLPLHVISPHPHLTPPKRFTVSIALLHRRSVDRARHVRVNCRESIRARKPARKKKREKPGPPSQRAWGEKGSPPPHPPAASLPSSQKLPGEPERNRVCWDLAAGETSSGAAWTLGDPSPHPLPPWPACLPYLSTCCSLRSFKGYFLG